nr:unnamed protein product [Digitaria exilis]
MPSIAGGGRLFAAHRGGIWWLRRRQHQPFSSLAGGGGRGGAPHLPVLIVGAGPVGLVLSFLLTKFGIKCAVIEKNVEFTRHPRAHFINNRTMEIFRKLDGLAGEIERSQPPVDLWRKFVYCTSLSGSVLGSVDHMKQEGQFSSSHFECLMSCTSYKLVDLLLKKLEVFIKQVCEQIIVKLVGWEPADIQVLDIKPWAMHAEVAEKYVGCNNRVVLAGDAAHRFPPAGGFGMNTGVQDAHNLAWKLGLMLNGVASPSIMQTYESERRPVAIFNTELSVENFKAAMSIPATLGLDPTLANSVHQVINKSLGSIIPRNVQKAVLEGLFSIGRAQLSDYILNEKNPLGSLRLARLRSILDEGKSLQLQFPAEDLGFCYEEGALVAEDCGEKPQKGAKLRHSKRASREYIPSANTGARLPHMQIRALPASSEGVFSTLDLVSGDKLEFVLIIAPLKESYEIARATLKVADEFKLSAKVCVMWPQGSASAEVEESRSELAPWTNYVDVEEVPMASGSSWWEMCRISRKSVILVRPDEHIAWRMESDMMRDTDSEVRRAFSQILCLN